MAKDEKPKTESGTPAGTGQASGGIDLAELVKQYATMGGSVQQGPTFTSQDANVAVQTIYQQILGRNAVGAERTQGINIFLNQPAEAGADVRQQAVLSAVEQTPEFLKRQDNRYLDAIYARVAREVQEAQG